MNKQAYVFLNSSRVLQWQWLRLKARHDELKSCLLPAAIRYDKEKVQTMPEDKFTEIMASIMDLEKQMNELQIERVERIKLITDTILEIPNEEAKTALTMRFISRTPVSEIAKEMGYAEPSIYKFLNQGADWIAQNKNYIKNINIFMR